MQTTINISKGTIVKIAAAVLAVSLLGAVWFHYNHGEPAQMEHTLMHFQYEPKTNVLTIAGELLSGQAVGKAALKPDGEISVSQVPPSVFHRDKSFSFSIPMERDTAVSWQLGGYRMPLVDESSFDITLHRVDNGEITDVERITDQPSRESLRAMRQTADGAQPAQEAEPPVRDYVMIRFPEESWSYDPMEGEAPTASELELANPPYFAYRQGGTVYVMRSNQAAVPVENLPGVGFLQTLL